MLRATARKRPRKKVIRPKPTPGMKVIPPLLPSPSPRRRSPCRSRRQNRSLPPGRWVLIAPRSACSGKVCRSASSAICRRKWKNCGWNRSSFSRSHPRRHKRWKPALPNLPQARRVRSNPPASRKPARRFKRNWRSFRGSSNRFASLRCARRNSPRRSMNASGRSLPNAFLNRTAAFSICASGSRPWRMSRAFSTASPCWRKTGGALSYRRWGPWLSSCSSVLPSASWCSSPSFSVFSCAGRPATPMQMRQYCCRRPGQPW